MEKKLTKKVVATISTITLIAIPLTAVLASQSDEVDMARSLNELISLNTEESAEKKEKTKKKGKTTEEIEDSNSELKAKKKKIKNSNDATTEKFKKKKEKIEVENEVDDEGLLTKIAKIPSKIIKFIKNILKKN